MNLANCLTMLRIAAVPLFLYLFSLEGISSYWIALVFVLTGITDILDGRLARARNQVTRFGVLADPLADKLIMLAAIISLASRGNVPMWVAGLLVVKEVALIIGAGFFLVSKSKVTPASRLGKSATVLLYVGVTGSILGIAYSVYLVLLGVGVSLIAGLDYLRQALQR
ncbi:MAG: CDP-diacylglycerol--glycerol-3-phosphate 3-phosphatidyltransferase [Firmicutes bacterium]|nr:CDP-diacylglycerol--glycerol-3-phosphate 3-phosphatidyltransferase [Bacillota bacterium]